MLARTRLLLTLPLLARGMSAQSARTCDAFEWHWLPSTTSTQDATKELLKARSKDCGGRPLAVATAHQTAGRGTRGRVWKDDGSGNVALTVALKMKASPLSPITLVPLRVGVEIARVLQRTLDGHRDCQVSLKWPNDVLLNGKKVSGVLIEGDGDDLLVRRIASFSFLPSFLAAHT